ncbi:hypothetical protein DY000_02006942 [Brassica cretica]|uniref:DET1- and DDB1-associated protein 1 n=1 Tax=Brassica cretica TaxID=69181 RepID=A0ABQ7BWM8_BRACR|nr:hypothetical protein DY000_02006942 [Brassica cretica]
MESSEHRPTHHVQHRSTPSSESIAFFETVRIMTHEGFAARHPHPPPTLPVSPRKTSIGNNNHPPIYTIRYCGTNLEKEEGKGSQSQASEERSY